MVTDLAARMRIVKAYELPNNAFIPSLVEHIVRTAKPTSREERELLTKLREFNQGFNFLKRGRQIVNEQAISCRKALKK